MGGTYINPNEKEKDYREIQKVELVFKAGELLFNKYTIPKKVLEDCFNHRLNNIRASITRNRSEISDSGVVKINNVIGYSNNYEILLDGTILIHVIPTIKTELFDGTFKLSPVLYGEIGENYTIKFCSLTGFYIAGPKVFIKLKEFENETK